MVIVKKIGLSQIGIKKAGNVSEEITVDDVDDEFSVLLRKYRKAMDSFLKGDIEVEATATPKAEKNQLKKLRKINKNVFLT